jgi:hypothetical protein
MLKLSSKYYLKLFYIYIYIYIGLRSFQSHENDDDDGDTNGPMCFCTKWFLEQTKG